jgi:hypothetical protein
MVHRGLLREAAVLVLVLVLVVAAEVEILPAQIRIKRSLMRSGRQKICSEKLTECSTRSTRKLSRSSPISLSLQRMSWRTYWSSCGDRRRTGILCDCRRVLIVCGLFDLDSKAPWVSL